VAAVATGGTIPVVVAATGAAMAVVVTGAVTAVVEATGVVAEVTSVAVAATGKPEPTVNRRRQPPGYNNPGG